MLKKPYMIKQVVGNTDLTLEADAGESILVQDIFICNPTGNYITVKVDKATVGYFRVGGSLGNHLALPSGNRTHSHSVTVSGSDGSLSEDHAVVDAYGQGNANLALFSDASSETEYDNVVGFAGNVKQNSKTILSLMRDMGVFTGFPIAEGQTMTITGASQSGSVQVVIYQVGGPNEFNPEQPNGSEATKFQYMNYGRVGAAITTSTDTNYDTAQSPSEFPDFPFGKDCPAKYRIKLHGICASDAVDERGSDDNVYTTYLKLIQERITLLDEDRNGILLRGIDGTTADGTHIARGYSLIGNFSTVDTKLPLLFHEPLVFESGEELGIYLSTVADTSQSSASLSAAETEIGLLMSAERS